MTERPDPPWTIEYADGAANLSRLTQASAGDDVAFEYVPVTPERSSTGRYSGGPPRSARLPADDPRVAEVWRMVAAMQADTARYAAARAKGSGAFTLTNAAGVERFLVERGEPIVALDLVLAAIGRDA